MSIDPNNMPKVFQLYLELSQYPILAKLIRQRMREEIFARGIVSHQVFEQEVRDKAIQSQQVEGLSDPLTQEPPHIWQERQDRIRDHLTDFYFAYNLPHDLFRQLVREVVSQRAPNRQVFLTFNPELAPWDVLFAQGEAFESYPPSRRKEVEHHLRQVIVVIIKAMISDQLSFVRVAREYFTVHDLNWIRHHRIGRGKIGGKAAGMLLAQKILEKKGEERGIPFAERFGIPESWFLGSDVYYDFHSANDLFRFMNQKYKTPDQMRSDYPHIRQAYLRSVLPSYVLEAFEDLLEEVGHAPLIVRSSSLLEDNFDTSFAGKYDSFFLPNQGNPVENLEALADAVMKVYASVVRPEALIYRERMNLTDYDERMAILIQKVDGVQHGRYFFPAMAGVGFSRNPYQWNERIRREDGLLRLVTGLGTRAVDRVGNDYPRMVALSHPELRPESNPRMVHRYSQNIMDLIDLEENTMTSLPIREVVDKGYPGLGSIFSVDRSSYVETMRRRPLQLDPAELVVTFDRVLAKGDFTDLMRDALNTLQQAYGRPVDIEFAAHFEADFPTPQVTINILQCRALSQRADVPKVTLPTDLHADDVLFITHEQVPDGLVEEITYIVYVDPRTYNALEDSGTRADIARVVGMLNHKLEGETFVLVGPGRWGTSNMNLGVKVTYAEIYNTRMLIEVAYPTEGDLPELSHGTHFFQDLVEANIYPLPVYPDDEEGLYHEAFFTQAANHLTDLLPAYPQFEAYIRVIDVCEVTGGAPLTIAMSGDEEKAIAYFARED
jgi:hypothetical protein